MAYVNRETLGLCLRLWRGREGAFEKGKEQAEGMQSFGVGV